VSPILYTAQQEMPPFFPAEAVG